MVVELGNGEVVFLVSLFQVLTFVVYGVVAGDAHLPLNFHQEREFSLWEVYLGVWAIEGVAYRIID